MESRQKETGWGINRGHLNDQKHANMEGLYINRDESIIEPDEGRQKLSGERGGF